MSRVKKNCKFLKIGSTIRCYLLQCEQGIIILYVSGKVRFSHFLKIMGSDEDTGAPFAQPNRGLAVGFNELESIAYKNMYDVKLYTSIYVYINA